MILDFPRRAFLHAVGALWGLSYTDQVELTEKRWGEDTEPDHPDPPDMSNCADDVHWSCLHEDAGYKGSVGVGMDPRSRASPVAIECNLGGMRFAVGFSPAEARDVADTLRNAADAVEQQPKDFDGEYSEFDATVLSEDEN